MIETTITQTELDALVEAFEGWSWGPESIEPDARVDVLIEEPASETKFLVRHQHGWVWAVDAANAIERSKNETVFSWNGAIDGIDGELRIPTADELRAGGWEVVESDEQENEEKLPFAAEQLLAATELLEREDNRPPTAGEIAEAQALALVSIGATLLDLHELIEDEMAWRRSQRPDPDAVEKEGTEEDDSAHRSLGPTEDPGFSFSGR